MLNPCPGCGALFPPHEGPVHRYIGASAGCWALMNWSVMNVNDEETDILRQSRVPDTYISIPELPSALSLDALIGDAYGVQHHGDDSPQAIQSVAVHLLNLYGIITGRTTRPRWPIERALRIKCPFHKLEPPAPGSALTIRHLFSGGGVEVPVSRSQYVYSVYDAWINLHIATIENWYEEFVVSD